MKKCFETNATSHTPALSSIFNNPIYTLQRPFLEKKCPNFYALYNDRDET